ncbi:MAG: family 10 glycosylhydrolase [Firmicutes bacterium]|nr:family 10 glycosylhydrolase [Bacillota bacterium]
MKHSVIKLFAFLLLAFFTFFQPVSAVETSPETARNREPVRGVWITVTDSKVLYSRQNIAAAMEKLKTLGINNAYVVVWRQGRTVYPSNVMKKLTGIEIQEDMKGRDPLQECIKEGHKRGIKVHAWFEFGFASSYQDNGGILLKIHPDWACIGKDGKPVVKNGFYWMNSLNPEVQNLMTSLFSEVVEKYKVDGVQGDDRLPAMPVEGGYDSVTSALYEKETGKKPPSDFREAEWVQWRSDRLTLYMETLSKTLRKIKPEIIISSSPSIYPWSRDEYLQDWICWVEKGYVDYACPQIYRRNFADYKKEMDSLFDEYLAAPYHDRIFPGLLLKVGKYRAEKDLIDSMIKENRNRGVEGEVYFFYEGL